LQLKQRSPPRARCPNGISHLQADIYHLRSRASSDYAFSVWRACITCPIPRPGLRMAAEGEACGHVLGVDFTGAENNEWITAFRESRAEKLTSRMDQRTVVATYEGFQPGACVCCDEARLWTAKPQLVSSLAKHLFYYDLPECRSQASGWRDSTRSCLRIILVAPTAFTSRATEFETMVATTSTPATSRSVGTTGTVGVVSEDIL
jgi:hypothetical protein